MKQAMDDVIAPKRKLSQVLPSGGRAGERPPVPPPRPPLPPLPEEKGRRYGLWALAVVALVVLAGAVSLLFSGVTVTVVPKYKDVLVNGTWSALREAVKEDDLVYEVMKIEKFGSRTVPASGEEDVAEKASGTIVIYNNYGTGSQRLIKNTRFETPDGLIYRIDRPITVPGRKTAGGVTTPGQVEATVYADQPGESYNIGLSDFTIPGLKGSPQFDKIYARSKTPMTGGFKGRRLTVAPDVLERTKQEIETELKASLATDAASQTPQGFLLFEGGTAFGFETVPGAEGNGTVEVKERGTLYGAIFDARAFGAFVAKNTAAEALDDGPVEILDPAQLSLTLIPPGATFWEGDKISFTLSGNARIVSTLDEEKLKADLAGKKKEALETVLSGYPGVAEAKVVMRPFWMTTFPEDPASITITRSFDAL